MVNKSKSLAGLAALSSLANAKIYELPQATTSFNFPLDQFSPQPTKAPAYADLRKRQASTTTTVLVAPDNTCGYISGRAGAAYTCGTAASCIFFTSVNRNTPGRVACCDASDCGARRTCYDSKQVSSSSLCDGGCLVDRFTLKCTNTARPYCNTISFADGIFDYWCNTADISTPQAATTTYAGGPARNWTPLALTDDTTSSSVIRPASSGVITGTASGSVSAPSITTSPDNDNNGGINNNNNSKSSTPVGAIVGGVIGGIAVIALIGFGIFFILRKKKKTQQQPGPGPHGQPPMMNQQQQHQPPPMGYAPAPQGSPAPYAAQTQTHSFYEPKYDGQGGYPQQHYGSTPPPPPQQGGGYQQPYYSGNMAVPDRADTTSPSAMSQGTHSNRLSTRPVSPNHPQGGFQQFGGGGQPQPTIHEAPASGDGHKGQMHELA
ncbi:hypothetical protein CTAM01_02442 [Colletotrichum tamarilloi]|uniref:DUF1620 domain-containing protein n=1 Tax=Colletotrichum tamarilloi TaxID=1209934 RepID=A0ABQ9RNT5_9PEZI|nr:uncharacterized protein CTAM01_02442 [Colletotrichum tamarilloi]KAK1508656.1 hypothetical protein CTAM01_02442 [Colletotrichum tamarilloi]